MIGILLITLPISKREKYFMKTSIMNGLNSSKLEYNYMISFRPKKSPKFELMETTISLIFSDIIFNNLIYYWEKDKLISKYHSHILVETYSENVISKIYSNIKGKSSIYSGRRELLVKTQTKNGFKDKKCEVDFTEFYGGLGKVYVEPIVEKTNACYYISKFSDRGIISGFLSHNV
jgi:hypothetical protein